MFLLHFAPAFIMGNPMLCNTKLSPLPSVQSEYRGNHAILEQYNFLHHPTENEDKMRTETLSKSFAILVSIIAFDLT